MKYFKMFRKFLNISKWNISSCISNLVILLLLRRKIRAEEDNVFFSCEAQTNRFCNINPTTRITTEPEVNSHHLLPPKTSEHCSYSLRKRKHYYRPTSCLMLNFRCIKTVLLIDACLSLNDTLYVSCIFNVLCVFIAF